MRSLFNPLLVIGSSTITSALKTKLETDPQAFVEDTHCAKGETFTDGSIPWGCKPMRHESFFADNGLDAELPTITVVSATYGGRHDLHGLLNYTFFSQSYPESKLDLLVLEDNSTRDSPLAQYWSNHSRVKYVRIEGAHPIGWKRNWLLGRARGDVIVHFDDDDFYNTFYVRYMVEYLHKYRESQVKLVKIASWVNVYPSHDHWEQFNRKPTFEAKCAEWPDNGFAFAWVYYTDVRSKCGFEDVDYGEEDHFLECLLEKYSLDSVHQIGDVTSQLIKVDTCAGITSAGSLSRRAKIDRTADAFDSIIADDDMIAMYGRSAWSALHEFGLAHVDLANCVGRKDVQRRRC